MIGIFRNKSGCRFLSRILNSPGFSFHVSSWRSLQNLAYEDVRASSDKPYDSTAFILHGLLGSGRNWRSFSRNLLSRLSNSSSTEWRLVLVDLRNHGRSAESEGFDPPHDMVNAAKDLAKLVESQGWAWPDVVMGHSMGGKVALQFAQSCNRGDYGDSASLPKQHLMMELAMIILSRIIKVINCIFPSFLDAEQLWVLDSIPGNVDPENSDGEVEKVLKTLQGLPSSVPSRKWLVNHMIELGFSRSLSEWIGSNLKKSGEHETWSFNLEGAVQMFNSFRKMIRMKLLPFDLLLIDVVNLIRETSYWSLLEHPPKDMEIAIVRAENSDRWSPEVVRQLERLSSKGLEDSKRQVSVHVLPNSGHWVHVDNPKGLLDIVAPKFSSL
ncbi:hypothetical protein SDJN02_09301 [Cucurbita argyrosperma subsp. argyrosperma]|nr:hypothetical protein SDJN02_09301 [Cucurbita argyrosperma subsp. argyrosperma]